MRKALLLLLISLLVAVGVFLAAKKQGSFSTEERATSLVKKCSSSGDQRQGKVVCYAQELKKLAREQGFKSGFEVLLAVQEKDAETKQCHLIAHAIGYGAYERAGGNWEAVINEVLDFSSSECAYGAVHGVLEEFIGSLGQDELTEETVEKICGSSPEIWCSHAIGHLFLIYSKADLSRALEQCRMFEREGEYYLCNSGVFMEQVTALGLVEHELVSESWANSAGRLEELEALCRSFTGQEAVSCWEETSHAALLRFNYSLPKVFSFCDTAQLAQAVLLCKLHAVGIIVLEAEFNAALVKDRCRELSSQDNKSEELCYSLAVVPLFVDEPQRLPDMVKFCWGLGENFQEECLKTVGDVNARHTQYGVGDDKLKTEECEKLQDKFRSLCLGLGSKGIHFPWD